MGRGRFETDVFVIGAGAAGLAAAIAARQEGFYVSVADCGAPLSDDASGEGLLPAGVAALRKLGVTLGLKDGVPFRGMRFAERAVSAQGDFPNGWGRGVRRITLYKLLMERAWRLGVEMNWGVRVSCGQAGSVYANGQEVRSRWIVGADGHNSRVRNWVGLGADFVGQKLYALRRRYRVTPWTERVEIHWGAEYQLSVTPTGERDVCVTALTANRKLRFAEVLKQLPQLAERLAGIEFRDVEAAEVGAPRKLWAVCRGNVALVGDASVGVDALTGDTLSLALQHGLSLATALRNSDLRPYAKEHRRLALGPRMMSRLMSLMRNYGWLRRRLLSAFSMNPAMFSRVLAAHAGTMNLGRLALDYAPEFTWKILTARDLPSSNQLRSHFDGES